MAKSKLKPKKETPSQIDEIVKTLNKKYKQGVKFPNQDTVLSLKQINLLTEILDTLRCMKQERI